MQLLPLAELEEGDAVELLMLYEPQDGPAPDPKTGPDTAVSLEIREVYTATLPFAMLLCLASLGLLVFGAGTCAVALWYWPPARATERPDFMRNPRLRAPAVRAVLGVGALLIAVAASWGVVAAATTHGMLPAPWLIGCSVALGCTGLLVLGAVGLWALHDPQQYHCPVCLDPVSRWRFVGTYAPAFFGEGRRRCKGHTDCVRCVRCRKPVRHSHWRHAPIHRLYHNHCWYAHCAEVSRDPTYAQRWAETHGAAVSDEELVHMLARAIDDSAFESIAGLIAMRSDLRTTPVAAEKGESALHIAARTGKVALLEVLFADLDRIDAEDCVVDADTGPSLAIAGLEGDHNDVYVCEPTVQYNGKPVYVGQAHGKYVYHYNARADPDGPEPFPDGWCVSKYLGNGSPPFRLLLDPPESTDAPIAAESLADPDSPVPAIRHAPYSLKNFGSWLAAVFARDISVPAAGTGNLLDDGVRGVTEYPCAEAGCRDITPEELQLQRLPHCLSVLQAAAASGAVEGVQYVIGRYKALHPRMLCWERFVEHGLWQPYPAPVQVQIANALERGDAQVTVDIGSNAEARPASLNLSDFSETTLRSQGRIRSRLRTTFQYRDRETGADGFSLDFASVPPGADLSVLFTSGQIAAAVPDQVVGSVLPLLCREGVVDASLWDPPCKIGSALTATKSGPLEEAFELVLATEVNRVLEVMLEGMSGDELGLCSEVAGLRRQLKRRASRDGRAAGNADTGIGGRLTDGLHAPETNAPEPFYEADYRSNVGTLPFCAALPSNPLGLEFHFASLLQMGHNALMRLQELTRQKCPLSPKHVVAIYVYTYELQPEEEGDTTDQIYAAMNAAMRDRNAAGIAFWRPLIWEVDSALQRMPAFHGSLYRGIACRFPVNTYVAGQTVCWPSFSSASHNKSVGEKFSEGKEGSLFFLQSLSARSIEALSRYPEEAEVLFPPNTVFTVTHTLHGSDVIGQFYARKVDNIAMTETEPLSSIMSCLRHKCTNVRLQVPRALSSQLFTNLAHSGMAVVESVDVIDHSEIGFRARLTTDAPENAIDSASASATVGASASFVIPEEAEEALALSDLEPFWNNVIDSRTDLTASFCSLARISSVTSVHSAAGVDFAGLRTGAALQGPTPNFIDSCSVSADSVEVSCDSVDALCPRPGLVPPPLPPPPAAASLAVLSGEHSDARRGGYPGGPSAAAAGW